MKFCIFLLFFSVSYSQQIKGVVLDIDSDKPIEFVNVLFKESKFGTFTNFNGEFSFKNSNPTDSLYFSCIGYELKTHSASGLKSRDSIKIYLKQNINVLNEVIVESKIISKKYTRDKKIKPKYTAKETGFFSFQFGTEHCVYIENQSKVKGKIQSLTLDLKKVISYAKECEKCEIDYITDYYIKFYEYDNRNKRPGKELYLKPIIVTPENKTYKLEINVDTLNIPFPRNGVCVGIEYLNMKYEKPKQAGAFIGPAINFERVRDLKEMTSWVRYRNLGNWEFKTSLGADSKSRYFDRLKMDLKVKFEKE